MDKPRRVFNAPGLAAIEKTHLRAFLANGTVAGAICTGHVAFIYS